MRLKFPKELGDIHLNLLCSEHRFNVKKGDENEFDFVNVVQSCELVRFCIFQSRELHEKDKKRFDWVDQGLFFLKQVLSNVYDNKYYWDVQRYAKISIREHPLCVAWKRIINSA